MAQTMIWQYLKHHVAHITTVGLNVAGALTVLGVVTAGCTTQTAVPDVTLLTASQAAQMAATLHTNYQATGALFTLTATDDDTGQTVILDGAVDFVEVTGHARVTGFADAAGVVTDVAWSQHAVGEKRTSGPFVFRPVELSTHPVDRLIAIVHGLATTTADNAQLIAQNPGAGFVRDDMLRGTDVSVLRYSQRSTYWIAKDTGRLLRFEGRDQNGGSPVVVDLLELGQQTIVLPPVANS